MFIIVRGAHIYNEINNYKWHHKKNTYIKIPLGIVHFSLYREETAAFFYRHRATEPGLFFL